MIASLRKMQGMSQEQLAEKAKISRSHLSSIEAPNIMRPFSLEVLYKIADALGVRAGDLLNSNFPTGKKPWVTIENKKRVSTSAYSFGIF